MANYIYHHKHWPDFQWDEARIIDPLAAVRYQQGRLTGQMENLGFNMKGEANLLTLTEEVVKSSEIEGEILNNDQVRSSIARKLGLEVAGQITSDRNVDGVVDMMMDATQNFQQPLSDDRLFGWHHLLFPSGRIGFRKISVGQWRSNSKEDPMQVVSGPMGKETIHFQAPDSALMGDEMNAFISWFNSERKLDPIIKAAIAHLWLVTIHPFDDGNGRIARAIAEMQLARSDNSKQRFYSMSGQIRKERNEYYAILEETQKGTLDITAWILWFLSCLERALESSKVVLSAVINKAAFWEHHRHIKMNDRQKSMMNKLLDQFDGKLTSTKWAKITGTSSDSALRDIQDLIDKHVVVRVGESKKGAYYKLRSWEKG